MMAKPSGSPSELLLKGARPIFERAAGEHIADCMRNGEDPSDEALQKIALASIRAAMHLIETASQVLESESTPDKS